MKQQLLLLEDVDALGKKGEVVSAKPGYIRNFLLPQKKAVMADKSTIHLQEKLKEVLNGLDMGNIKTLQKRGAYQEKYLGENQERRRSHADLSTEALVQAGKKKSGVRKIKTVNKTFLWCGERRRGGFLCLGIFDKVGSSAVINILQN